MDNPLRVIVIDNVGGCYLSIAKALTKYYKKVYYYSITQSPFPTITLEEIGKGCGVEVINELWNRIDDFDIVVFPDIYFSDYGSHMRKLGKKVWGGGISETIETNRKLFKDELFEAGMAIAPTQYITGVRKLAKYLDNKKDKWVKITYYRGLEETFHHIDMTQTQPIIDKLLFSLGPIEDRVPFLIEDPIKSVAEIGYDGYSINGMYPFNVQYGLEVKNSCYIGKASTQKELPLPIVETNAKFASVLKKYGHKGFYSTEIRVGDDGKNYYVDPCMRAGSPPSNTYMSMIDNWDKIIEGGAIGKIVEPHFIAKYGVEIILKSSQTNCGWLPLSFPDEYKDNIKLKGCIVKDNIHWIIPFGIVAGYELEEVGSVVVVGDDLQTIMTKALEIADSITSTFDIRYDKDALKNGMKTINDMEDKLKITF